MIAIFAVFLVTAGVDWMWEETAVAALGLGAIAVAAAGGSRRLRRRRRRGRLWRPGVRPAAVALALLAAAVQVPGLVATQRVRASQAAARAGDLPRSEQLAREAIDAEPWAAGPHLQLALVLEARRAPRAEPAGPRRAASRPTGGTRSPSPGSRRRGAGRGRRSRPSAPAAGCAPAPGGTRRSARSGWRSTARPSCGTSRAIRALRRLVR